MSEFINYVDHPHERRQHLRTFFPNITGPHWTRYLRYWNWIWDPEFRAMLSWFEDAPEKERDAYHRCSDVYTLARRHEGTYCWKWMIYRFDSERGREVLDWGLCGSKRRAESRCSWWYVMQSWRAFQAAA